MKLFLTSDGIFKGLREEDRRELFDLVGKSPADMRLAFIPTAGYPYIKQKHVDAAFEGFRSCGISAEIVDLKEEGKKSLVAKLADVDIIYVNGGSSYWLLHWVRESGFDKVIHHLLDQGKVYVGVSAGSIITGPDIKEMTESPNVTDMKDSSGLGLVRFVIKPHYSEPKYEDLLEKSKRLDYPIIALPDHQAVLVDGDICRIIGEGPKTVFNDFEMLLEHRKGDCEIQNT